jgi:hypothetical protein
MDLAPFDSDGLDVSALAQAYVSVHESSKVWFDNFKLVQGRDL